MTLKDLLHYMRAGEREGFLPGFFAGRAPIRSHQAPLAELPRRPDIAIFNAGLGGATVTAYAPEAPADQDEALIRVNGYVVARTGGPPGEREHALRWLREHALRGFPFSASWVL